MARHSTLVERRTDIISATMRVLARDGIAETTTRKIAAEAGVNQATLRYYFGSKDDLLFAVLQEMMQKMAHIVQESTLAKRNIPEMIAESIKAFWSHVESEPELQIMQYELTLYALRHLESAWLAKQQYDGYAAMVEDLLRKNFEGRNHPCAIPFAELARFIISGLDGLILQFISDRNAERARRDLEHLITAVVALVEGRSST